MLRISQLKLPVEHTEAQLKKKLLKTAHIKEQDLKQFFIRKRSVDGRKKPELYYVYTVCNFPLEIFFTCSSFATIRSTVYT